MTTLNRLTTEEYKKGAMFAFENAEKHLHVAAKIADTRNFGMAISHLILSLEELSKAVVLKIKSSGDEIQIKNLDKYFRNHNVKHEAIINIYLATLLQNDKTADKKSKSADSRWIILVILAIAFIAITLFLSDKQKKELTTNTDFLNEMRNHGFYVDYDIKNKKWRTPLMQSNPNDYKETEEIVTLFLKSLKQSLFEDKFNKQDILRFIKELGDENIITPDLKDDLKEIEETLY